MKLQERIFIFATAVRVMQFLPRICKHSCGWSITKICSLSISHILAAGCLITVKDITMYTWLLTILKTWWNGNCHVQIKLWKVIPYNIENPNWLIKRRQKEREIRDRVRERCREREEKEKGISSEGIRLSSTMIYLEL